MRARVVRTWLGVAALAACSLAAWEPRPAAANDIPVDLELVLAVDVSGSMDMAEQELQRAGYMAAITHPEILGALRGEIYGRIAVAYVEWAGAPDPMLTVPWTLVEDERTAQSFAEALGETPIGRFRGTSIAKALMFSSTLFADNGFEGMRQVIDVSGDGPNNMGPPVVPVRDEVLAAGIIINGLPIMLHNGGYSYASIPNLDRYYELCVIGGPNSFVLPVRDPSELTTAIRQKLLLEIAGAAPRFQPAAAVVPVQMEVDCMIGERQRRSWDFYGR